MNEHSSNLLPAEGEQIAIGSTASAGEIPHDRCLNLLFEEQVARSPDAVAVVFEDRSLSYAELNRRANQLAHYLGELGVGPEVVVAVCVEPSVEMIVALLAVLKAGGAYLPLDPAFPVERLRFMIEDSAPVALLTQSLLLACFQEFDLALEVFSLNATNPPWSNHPETNPDAGSIGLNSGHLAQILYTSGSTGKPKGVLIEHRGLVVQALWFVNEFKLTNDYAGLVATSSSFLTVYKNMYGPLFVGGQLHVVRNQKDPNAVISAAFRANVTLLNLTPTTFSMLIEADSKNELSKIQTVLPTGEPLRLHLFAKLRNPRPEFVNTYGQTECGTASIHRIRPDMDDSGQETAPIGRPLPYARIYILNEQGDPVPTGAVGELYIGGAGLARGYLNRPDLTAERFLPDTFSAASGARMYRSGDLGRWLPDGTIELLGRNDFQVKIRGVRIEPGEIEARLMEYPGVREAAVIVREDNPGDERLVAYYLASRSGDGLRSSLHPGQLRFHMAAGLPERLVPAAYVRLDSWPTTPNMKLDRKALPQPNRECYASTEYEPPQGPMETEMVSIWANVLKLDQVGRRDNFFFLGGNSLLAMQVEIRLRKAFGIEVPVARLFESPTVESFAEAVEAMVNAVDDEAELLRILGEIEAMPEIGSEGAA